MKMPLMSCCSGLYPASPILICSISLELSMSDGSLCLAFPPLHRSWQWPWEGLCTSAGLERMMVWGLARTRMGGELRLCL